MNHKAIASWCMNWWGVLSANNSGYSMPNKSRFHLLQSKIAGTNSVVIEIEQMELALVDDLVGYKAQLK